MNDVLFLFALPELEAIKIHYLVPCGDEVMHELLLCIVASVDFRDGPELGVGTEDEVDTGGGPLEFAGFQPAC